MKNGEDAAREGFSLHRLVSCPMCGAPGKLHTEHPKLSNGTEDTLYFVQCSARRCGTGTLKWYPAAAAVAAWNKRAANDLKLSDGPAEN